MNVTHSLHRVSFALEGRWEGFGLPHGFAACLRIALHFLTTAPQRSGVPWSGNQQWGRPNPKSSIPVQRRIEKTEQTKEEERREKKRKGNEEGSSGAGGRASGERARRLRVVRSGWSR